MNEAVSIVKGVLGFEDVALSSPPRLRRQGTKAGGAAASNQAQPSTRMAQRRDTSSSELRPLVSRGEGGDGNEMTRWRSRSDPFDSPVRAAAASSLSVAGKRGPAPPVPRHPPTGRRPSAGGTGMPIYDNPLSPGITAVDEPLLGNISPAMGFSDATTPHLANLREEQADGENDDDDEAEIDEDLTAPRLRLWTFPAHITDIEVQDLLAVLPRFLGSAPGFNNIRIPLPRPSHAAGSGMDDLEAQHGHGKEPNYAAAAEEYGSWPIIKGIRVPPESSDRYVRPGTGRLWVGETLRLQGWRGSLWERIKLWCRRLFGA